jgi:hypothetical protein
MARLERLFKVGYFFQNTPGYFWRCNSRSYDLLQSLKSESMCIIISFYLSAVLRLSEDLIVFANDAQPIKTTLEQFAIVW